MEFLDFRGMDLFDIVNFFHFEAIVENEDTICFCLDFSVLSN